ncbi:transcription elongation factor A TFIIS [Cardiosporidium cionae]|uniref:Transcription elongation factor A TFIIS n=1 Tax=Cardiosporidium cionae TaxID=476202 RepID=A0ABQ7J4W3_9APIC|nr:transcription elongation factor A TFIIS [Cardiosporidium cionae]|eukprot:KAF8818516.1 transcription elongation factor A TFIIS [Cardiosporidium cionae]
MEQDPKSIATLRSAVENAAASTSPSAETEILSLLEELTQITVNRKILAETGIGVVVGRLRSHAYSESIRKKSFNLVNRWKALIQMEKSASSCSGSSSSPSRSSTSLSVALPMNNTSLTAPLTTSVGNAGDSCEYSDLNGQEGTVSIQCDDSKLESLASPSSLSFSETKCSQDLKAPLEIPTSNVGMETHPASSMVSDVKQDIYSHTPPSGEDTLLHRSNKRPCLVNSESDVDSSYPPPFTGPLCGVLLRDKARKFLYNGFFEGLQDDQRSEFSPAFVAELIGAIEASLWNHFTVPLKGSKEYNMQLKSIKWNLADSKNPEFNLKIYSGRVSPPSLAAMESRDMASDAKKLEQKQPSLFVDFFSLFMGLFILSRHFKG